MLVKKLDLVPGMEPFRGYTLRQCLGEGAYGVVWEATKESGERVALKFLPYAAGRANRQEIKTIQMINKLDHPNLAVTYDVWSYKQYFVIAMELAEGSLNDLLKVYQHEYNSAIDPKELVRLLSQAANAMDFLNTRQHTVDGRTVAFQHCDIKPSNLLLFGETLKLADFGLMSISTLPVAFHRPVGTPAYMAPELIMGRLSDRSDQFSLAVSYVVLRTGKLPWSSGKPTSISDRPAWHIPDLSGLTALERPIVARSLSSVPQDRWASSTDLMDRLSEASEASQKRTIVQPKETLHGLSIQSTLHDRPKNLQPQR